MNRENVKYPASKQREIAESKDAHALRPHCNQRWIFGHENGTSHHRDRGAKPAYSVKTVLEGVDVERYFSV
jgi:hypothetical protein